MFLQLIIRSASAVLPVTMKTTKEKIGVNEDIYSFTLPIGTVMNMDGAAIYLLASSIFIAGVYGISFTVSQLMLAIFAVTIGSIGAASIPSAGLVILVIVLDILGLPGEGILLVAGIDIILDAMRSSVNVIGDMAGTTIIASTEENGLDRSILYGKGQEA